MSDSEGEGQFVESGGMEGAYRVLYAAPSAPQELIVELYWHLVRRVHGSDGKTDGDRGLLELNQAYEAILQAQRPGSDAPKPREVSREPATRGGQSPWTLLHVRPDAPPDVIDAAYRFWRLRARGEAPDQLAKLDAAYRRLSGYDDASPEPEPASIEEVHTADGQVAAGAAVAALVGVGSRRLAQACSRMLRWLAPRLGRAAYRGLLSLLLLVRWCWRQSRQGVRRAAPAVARALLGLASVVSSATASGFDGARRTQSARKVRSARPRPMTPQHQIAVPPKRAKVSEPSGDELDASVEERFAALSGGHSTG